MGTTFSRAAGAADQLDGKTIEEREVIGNIISTDVEGEQVVAEQVIDTQEERVVAEQAIPRQPNGTGAVEESSEVPSPTTPDRRNGADAAEAQHPSVVLSEAAKKAFMCYQRSAAEAVAHPDAAEPAAEQATPVQEAGHKGQKADEKAEASAPALGNSHRSRKRQMKQAASLGVHPTSQASQECTPGKRRRREYEKLLEYTQAISSDALKPRGSAGKRQKLSQEATPAKDAKKTPAKPQPTPRRKSAGWMYMGPDLTDADVPQEDWVTCPDGRSYPRSMTYKTGDLLIDEYLNKTDDDQLYVVEAIVDERRRGKKREFRVKWEGFEMNPEEWIPYSNVKDNVELDIWESKLGGDAE